MTKREMWALWLGRDDVADLNVVFWSDDPVDQQFDQLSPPGKGRSIQNGVYPYAGCLN